MATRLIRSNKKTAAPKSFLDSLKSLADVVIEIEEVPAVRRRRAIPPSEKHKEDYSYPLVIIEYVLIIIEAYGRDMKAAELRQFVRLQLIMAVRDLYDKYGWERRYLEDAFTSPLVSCELQRLCDEILLPYRFDSISGKNTSASLPRRRNH